MVAPTSPPVKPPPMLSYAERAKKAQGIKSAIEVLPPPTRVAQLHPPPPPPQSDPSTSTSAASSAPISSSATSVDETLNQTTRSSSPVAPVSSVVASNESTTTPSTGPAESSPDAAVKHAPNALDPGPSAPPKPQVNFWNQRIEKMAAARASSVVQKPNPLPQHIATPAAGITPSPNQASSSAVPTSKRPPSVPAANGVSAGKSKKNNAATSVEVDRADPFTVKVPPYLRKASPKASPNLPDPNDWPEVGKSLQASSSSASQLNYTDGQSSPDRPQNGVVTTPKKTERKWIPVPKEELQASADAASRASRSQSRNKAARQTLHPSSSTPNANSSSRPHSGHTSAAQSVSHSRVQSRSGSLQSSPKVPRGRRLPPGEPASNSSLPRTPDPISSARLSPLLVGESASVPNISLSASNSAVNSQRASPSLVHHHPILPIQASQSQPLPAHLSHRSPPFHAAAPIFYPHGSGHNSPHSLPHSQSMSPSTMYPPLPPQGYSPYPMFNPYEYPAAGPSFGPAQYRPWPVHGRNQPLSGSHSPSYPPPHMHHLPPHPLAHLPTLHQPQHQFGGLGVIDLQSRLPSNGISPTRTPPVSNDVSTTGQISSSRSMDSGVKEKMVFGSIQPSLPLSPVLSDMKPQDATGASTGDVYQGNEEDKGSLDRAFASFAIGVDSNETARLRSRTRQAAVGSPGGAHSGAAPVETPSQITPSVSTSSDLKWKFGTASSTPPDQGNTLLPTVDDVAVEEKDKGVQQQADQAGPLQTSVTMPAIPVAVSSMSGLDLRGSTSFVGAPSHLSLHAQTHPNHNLPSPPNQSPQPPGHSRHASQSNLELPTNSISPSMPTPSSPDPDLEVRNFGYGFGRDGNAFSEALSSGDEVDEAQIPPQNGDTRVNGIGNGPSERIRDQPHTRGGDYQYGRGRRSEFGRGRGYGGERGGPYGGGRRGRGINGFSRGYSGRGSYGAPRGSGPPSARTPSGFGGTPPSHFQSLPLDGSATPPGMPAPHPYYLSPQPQYTRHNQYMPSTYPAPPQMGHSSSIGHADVLSPPLPVVLLSVPGATQRPPQPPHLKPPVPVPMSTISFPLDSTRYYLLGQLEYYLSPQNLAQDFYLRQNMDERGWIPIPLIASFNRVTQLTMDVQLVKDVLTLSSIVQVRGNMVRMGGWEQYVLPDAKPSNVEEQPLPYSYQNLTPYYDGMVGLAGMPGNGIEEYPPGYRMPSLADPTSFPPTSGGISKMAENDEEEDEVEFVMGEVGTWSGGSPDRRT